MNNILNLTNLLVGTLIAVVGWFGQTIYAQVHENSVKLYKVEEAVFENRAKAVVELDKLHYELNALKNKGS